MKLNILIISSLCFILTSCSDETDIPTQVLTFDFQAGTQGWEGDFADYPNEPGVEEFYELEFSHSQLPSPLDNTHRALRQSGNNHSDDLFMFVKKKISGLDPNTFYSVSIELEIASNVAAGQVGVGGSPGESVYIKAGASTIEPLPLLDDENYFRMNIDIGNQSQGGSNATVLGDFSNESEANVYRLKTLISTSNIRVQANAGGELWLIAGTDSAFEATTTIYYNIIKIRIREG